MNAPTRLFGLQGAEEIYDDPATVWETDIEPFMEEAGSRVIVEFSVLEPQAHFPQVDHLIDHIYEWACDSGEVAEDWGEDFPLNDPHVKEAVEALYQVIADKIHYRMADKKVAEHTIEWDDSGENPLLDGKPLYELKEETDD